MESTDQYNFSIFRPRHLHGRKNRNVILTMLLIWAVAVFGFQFILKGIEKPTPEKALGIFESEWPNVIAGKKLQTEYGAFLNSLVLVMGKNTVAPADKQLLSEAISSVIFKIVPDSIGNAVSGLIAEREVFKASLTSLSGREFIDKRIEIQERNKQMIQLLEPYTGYTAASLEASIMAGSLKTEFPASFNDERIGRLPDIMQLYLTHNQSVLTDTVFLGFPFHYLYTAVFLLILFVGLCIVYNVLIEWRLRKEGIVE